MPYGSFRSLFARVCTCAFRGPRACAPLSRVLRVTHQLAHLHTCVEEKFGVSTLIPLCMRIDIACPYKVSTIGYGCISPTNVESCIFYAMQVHLQLSACCSSLRYLHLGALALANGPFLDLGFSIWSVTIFLFFCHLIALHTCRARAEWVIIMTDRNVFRLFVSF